MYLKNILFLLICYGVENVLSKAQLIPCALEDYKCTTAAADPLYKKIVNGLPDIGVPTSDPLHKDVIFGFLRDLNYTLTDAYMYGTRNCNVNKHRIFLEQLTWTFTLDCPRLVIKTNYEVTGVIDGNHIEGKGTSEVTDDDYHMVISGGFEFYKGVDGKSHMNVTYFDFEELEVLGKVNYVLHNLYNGDEVKSMKMHKYLNENWKSVSSTTHYPTMYAFIGKLLENISIYLAVVPADEIFYRNI